MERVSGVRASQGSPDASGDAIDDGIAMALLDAARELAEVKERIENLVNAHAERRGVTVAA